MRRTNWTLMAAGALAVALIAGHPPDVAAQKAAKAKGGAAKKPAPTPAPAPAANVDVGAARADLFANDADRAATAAVKLGGSKQAGALDALLDALSLGLHPRVAAAALGGLAAQGSDKSLEVGLYYANNRNADVRAAAVTLLGRLDDKRARAAVDDAFTDGDKSVRAAACKVAEVRKDKNAADPLIELLKKGDDATVPALAAIATPELARRLGELVGEAPDGLLAETLGLILLRTDFGKEEAYVQVVEVLGKIPGEEALVALTNYVSATPEKPPRLSRRRAQELYEARLTGGTN